MERTEVLSSIIDSKIMAIVRLENPIHIPPVIESLMAGGIRTIEITLGTPQVFENITRMSDLPNIIPGVGSVVDSDGALKAIDAGAKFIVTPSTKKEVIRIANQNQIPIFSGAFTPTEILQAYEWGADVIKLFPAGALGLAYYKAVKAPMPYIPIMPTGGINIDNAADWFKAGAVCLGIGGSLINKEWVGNNEYQRIMTTAQNFVNKLNQF